MIRALQSRCRGVGPAVCQRLSASGILCRGGEFTRAGTASPVERRGTPVVFLYRAHLVGVAQATAGTVVGGQRLAQVLIFPVQIKAQYVTAVAKIGGCGSGCRRFARSRLSRMAPASDPAPRRERQRSDQRLPPRSPTAPTRGKLSSLACGCTRVNRSSLSAGRQETGRAAVACPPATPRRRNDPQTRPQG